MSTVLYDVRGGIATITLNRPERLNAFDEHMAEGWAEATAAAIADEEVGAIIVAGAGRSFCAGGDLRAMAAMNPRSAVLTRFALQISDGMRALVESDKPVVAAAGGTTAGGGLGVLLSCDYAVVGESSKLGSLYAAMGLTPDLTVSALLGRGIGERRALQLTLTNSLISAAQALEWGLVAEVVADEEVLERARQIARSWVETPEAFGQAKRLLRATYGRSLAEQIGDEAVTIGRASQTPAAEERIQAFTTQRAAK